MIDSFHKLQEDTVNMNQDYSNIGNSICWQGIKLLYLVQTLKAVLSSKVNFVNII